MTVSSSSETCATEEPKMPGQHQAPDALHALPRAVEARARQEPDRVERGKLGNQLHDAGDEDADREHEARGREVRRDEPGRRDHDDV